MAYPYEFYIRPELGADYLTNEARKAKIRAARKAYRAKVGCSGCFHRGEQILGKYLCGIEETPHSGGWCSHWWDRRTGKPPR